MKVGIRNKGLLDQSLATLCVPPTATADEIRRAYRGLVWQLHPDTSGDTGSSEELTAVISAFHELADSGYLDDHPGDGIRRNGRLLDVLA
jgi:DnaJ-domain-containing protein 1